MFDWADISGSARNPNTFIATSNHSTLDDLYSIKARLGYAEGASLLYINGGFASAQNERFFLTGLGADRTVNTTKAGWIAGAGWEYAFASQRSWFVEYDHMNFGTDHGLIILGTPLDL
jgi:opacity protein-like surface antigen